jgi:hypothetical protein
MRCGASTRYLPTLQLKKQQLQLELRQIEARSWRICAAAEQALREPGWTGWLKLLAEPVDLGCAARGWSRGPAPASATSPA